MTSLSLSVYLITNKNDLNIRTLFVSLVLFSILLSVMEDVPKSFNQIREAKSALYRITDFLLSQEINDTYITHFRTIESIPI